MRKWGTLIIALAVLAACGVGERATGTLTVRISDQVRFASVIMPDDSLSAGSYVIAGTGTTGMATGVTFNETVAPGSTLTLDLPPGDYNISVTVWNDDTPAKAVGAGTATATVVIGSPASVTVTCLPNAGNGELFVDLTWQPDVITDASTLVTMRNTSGVDTEVTMTNTSSVTASGSATLPAGWYVGLLRIYDGPELNAGIARAVRIAASSETHWLEALTVNALTGTLTIDLLYNPGLPLAVTGSPAPGTYTVYRGIGQTFSVTGADNDGGTSLVYGWYVDGSLAAFSTSASFTYDGSAHDVGTRHYISAIVVQSDGKRAGELQYVVDVEAPDPAWLNVAGTVYDSPQSIGVNYTVELIDADTHAIVDSVFVPEDDFNGSRAYDLGTQASGDYHVRVVVPAGGDFPVGRTVYWLTNTTFTTNVASAGIVTVPHATGLMFNFTAAAMTP